MGKGRPVSLRQGIEPAGNRASSWDGPRCTGCRAPMLTRRPALCAECMPRLWADIRPTRDPVPLPPFNPRRAFLASTAASPRRQPLPLRTET